MFGRIGKANIHTHSLRYAGATGSGLGSHSEKIRLGSFLSAFHSDTYCVQKAALVLRYREGRQESSPRSPPSESLRQTSSMPCSHAWHRPLRHSMADTNSPSSRTLESVDTTLGLVHARRFRLFAPAFFPDAANCMGRARAHERGKGWCVCEEGDRRPLVLASLTLTRESKAWKRWMRT